MFCTDQLSTYFIPKLFIIFRPRKLLEDFIVHDSDVDANSDVSDSAEDSDEMFYVKVNHSLDRKENNYRLVLFSFSTYKKHSVYKHIV